MATTTMKTRIQNKHDTSANWAKATTFVPLAGEVIVYDDLKKIKIGDGSTAVTSLEFINQQSLDEKQDTLVFNTAYDASTNKVATMADLVSAGATAQVMVTVTPAAEVIVTLTNKATGDTYTGTTNSTSGVTLINVTSYGNFTISYQSAGAVNAVRSINIPTAGQVYQISATYSTSCIYTAKIDLNNSNPLSCVTYEDDAAGMTKGSSNWDNQLIFKDIKPCIFKDGEVAYYLNPDNYNQKKDGTTANIDGTDGDVMIEFPKFAYKIYKANANLYVSVTNNTTADGYCDYAFSKETEGDREHFYWGAYKGSLNSAGNLQSISGVAPAASKTIGAFKQLAQNRGDGYTITSWFQLVAIQCLYIIRYGNLNGQSAVGQGISGRTSSSSTTYTYGPDITGGSTGYETADKGMFYGSTSDSINTHVKVFGIEDFWGNIWEWIDGLTTDSSWNVITRWDYDNINTDIESFTTASGQTANRSGWTSNVFGTNEAGFMNSASSGSSTTYFCDYGCLYSGCVLIFGGDWDNGAHCGPFRLYANNSASYAYSNFGARLMYL